MKKIKMCEDEITNYFDENGTLRVKCKWEKENKYFVYTLRWLLVILFWFIPALAWLFEKVSDLFTTLDYAISGFGYCIERQYFKKKYLKDYIIPSKKEVKEYYKSQMYEVE